MRRRASHLAIGVVLVAALQGCGSDDKAPPKAVCGLGSSLVAAVLGTDDLSEGKSTDGVLSDVGSDQAASYSCDVETDSYENASVTAASDSAVVGADIRAKMEQMPVRYTYEQGDAALEIKTSGTGDAAVSSVDARWLCGPVNVRITAAAEETIREKDARDLLEAAADEVGCDPA